MAPSSRGKQLLEERSARLVDGSRGYQTHTLESIQLVFLPVEVVLVLRVELRPPDPDVQGLERVERVEEVLVGEELREDEDAAVDVRAVFPRDEEGVEGLVGLF